MIRYKKPDKNKALSLIQSARRDFEFTLTLKPTENSSNTIIRNIYESFRMIGEALLTSKGIESEGHILPINELIKLNIKTKRPLRLLDRLRKTRHNINYYGYRGTLEEAKDILSYSKNIFPIVVKEVSDQIK